MSNSCLDVALLDSSSKPSTALEVSFDQHLRPFLDVVDKLRNLGVMNEGIHLPTIVVIGDQSSGKSSVLESLAGVGLPKGQGIATRVPLILRLQKSEKQDINIEFAGNSKEITEEEILCAVEAATDQLAGVGKGICDKPITLTLSKPNAPDLTLVDLPGITRVPVQGQPPNIYDQIADIIRHYIAPEESIILNVISAAVDFPTCECIKMSKEADRKGERTLAVVTKVDKCPEDLYDKVMSNTIEIGLGYVCVRNRIDEDCSYEDARQKERELFENNPHLSQIPGSMVGVSTLAEKLMHIQAESIGRLLPRIVADIDKAYTSKRQMLEIIPQGASSPVEAHMLFIRLLESLKDTMQEVLVRGNVEVFPDNEQLHFTARMHEHAMAYAERLRVAGDRLLEQEHIQGIAILVKETKGVTLPNVVSDAVIKKLLGMQLALVSGICRDLVGKAHALAQEVAFAIVEKHKQHYPNFYVVAKQAAQQVVAECVDDCSRFVSRMLDKAAKIIFTLEGDDKYRSMINRLDLALEAYRQEEKTYRQYVRTRNVHVVKNAIEGVGEVDLSLLCSQGEGVWECFCNIVAYWKVVERRLAEEIPMELRYAIDECLLIKFPQEVIEKVFTSAGGGDVSIIVSEATDVAYRRKSLKQSVDVLQECKSVVSTYTAHKGLLL